MENDNEAIRDYVRRRVGPIFNNFLKEAPKNHISVGQGGKDLIKNCYYQPHNYRLYFDFDKTNFKPQTELKTDVLRSGGSVFKIVNSSELQTDFIAGFKIRVKKQTIEIINQLNHKKWYPIQINTNADEQFKKIVYQLNKECEQALTEFINLFGGKSEFKILRIRSEDKIQGEDSINAIPIKANFYNEVGKKVYNEHNFEFNNVAFASNYIKARAVENIAPELQDELKQLAKSIKENNQATTQALSGLIEVIKQNAVITSNNQQNTTKSIKALALLLKPKEDRIKTTKGDIIPEYIG